MLRYRRSPDIFDRLGMSSETLENAGKIETVQGFLEIEWKIPDFFSLEKKHSKLKSPVFMFFGVDWIIELHPSCDEFVQLSISNNRSIFGLAIYYTIGIKCFDGSIYKSASGIKRFPHLRIYRTTKHCFRRTCLRRDKMKIAPQDVLTVFCRLRHMSEIPQRRRSFVDGTTQTEIFQGHTSSEVAEKCLSKTKDEDSKGKDALLDLEGTDKLAADFKGLFLNGVNFDVIINIGVRKFRTHRLILGARSSVFQSMFSHDTTERSTGTVEIEDCEPDVFQDFLLFLYSGKMEKLSLENVVPLYTVADKYDVQEVKRDCVKFMGRNFCVDSFCDVVVLAIRHNEVDLLKTATDFFTKNTKKVILSANWQCFLKEYPVESNELYLKAIEYRDQE